MPRRRRVRAFPATLILLTFCVSAGIAQETSAPPQAPDPPQFPYGTEAEPPRPVGIWGEATFRAYAFGDQIAPNGLEFKALFRLDLDFNIMLCRSQGVYLFADTQFWGQRAAPGVTNPSQGPFDFSKREFDLTAGLAWNYAGSWEARAFAYSFNNLNRGVSEARPAGYNDGVGLENRYYLSPVYADLGTEAFDVSRATFLSVGYYPTKDMVDNQGATFKPGPFARAYLTLELLGEQCFLYCDAQIIASRSWTPVVGTVDAGLAFRPWSAPPRVEFRIGTDEMFDLRNRSMEPGLYGAVRIVY